MFDAGSFDLAIVDEATQASIPATLVPYTCADKLILAGDHKQLLRTRVQKQKSVQYMFHCLSI